MEELKENIQDKTNFNSPLGVGGNSSSPLGVGDKLLVGGVAEIGKTAKYLREKLGGIHEQAKQNLKEFNGKKKLILESLKEGDLTVKQLTEKLQIPSDEVVYYLMSLVKYGFVKTGDIDDMDEYFTYKLNK